MLFYVPYHIGTFLFLEQRKRLYLQSSSFLFFFFFLTDLGIMTASFLISRKPTALG